MIFLRAVFLRDHEASTKIKHHLVCGCGRYILGFSAGGKLETKTKKKSSFVAECEFVVNTLIRGVVKHEAVTSNHIGSSHSF